MRGGPVCRSTRQTTPPPCRPRPCVDRNWCGRRPPRLPGHERPWARAPGLQGHWRFGPVPRRPRRQRTDLTVRSAGRRPRGARPRRRASPGIPARGQHRRRHAGYWPGEYQRGSVWVHDTAIAIRGLATTGHVDEAVQLAEGLLKAAESFGYRIPELHSGDPATGDGRVARSVAFPSACRPPVWSAASAVVIADALGELRLG